MKDGQRQGLDDPEVGDTRNVQYLLAMKFQMDTTTIATALDTFSSSGSGLVGLIR